MKRSNTARFLITSVFLTMFLYGCSGSPEKGSVKEKIPSNEMIKQAQKILENGDLVAARDKYKLILSESNNPEDIEYVKNKIEDLNIKILFSNTIDQNSKAYKVNKGDALGKIAKRFNTTVELLKKANNLASDMIRVGQQLKVPIAEFSIVVDKSQNLLFLKKGEEVFKTYVVSTGKDNSTPIGEFTIVTKVNNPVWYRQDIGAEVPADSPENILGSRWMGFNAEYSSYGIHGTTEPNHLGTQVTKGCVRMRNQEVEELFSIVPRGTKVTIID